MVFLALAPVAQAQEPSLDMVLARAGQYVTAFRSRLSGIVSEERYEQHARTPSGARQRFRSYETENVVLKSDFLLVRPPGSDRDIEFRDVYEVDGRATRDREERLMRLFLDPSVSGRAQIQSIMNESARYNIGLIGRTLNTPTLALMFLDPGYQTRFRFARDDESKPTLDFNTALPEEPTDVWVVAYEEVQPRTVIRGKDDKDIPVRGRFWIEPSGGRVLASELIAKDPEVEAILDVRYDADPTLGQLVPVEMRERYIDRYGSRVDGTATYSNFRRFQVNVQETMPPEVEEHLPPQPESDVPQPRN